MQSMVVRAARGSIPVAPSLYELVLTSFWFLTNRQRGRMKLVPVYGPVNPSAAIYLQIDLYMQENRMF